MESFLSLIKENAGQAHFWIFGAALLAGLNIPISIDLLMIASAILAAQFVPHNLFYLFGAITLGCLFSAWISYWFGRTAGQKLLKFSFFAKLFPPKRMKKVKSFYTKRGPFALILGRFIPFGVRNCLFMSCGMSRMSFQKFALYDGFACLFWSTICFFCYYTLGKNIDVLYNRIKILNIFIFIAFSVTVISVVWYNKRKKTKEGNV